MLSRMSLLTTKEVAERLGVTVPRVHTFIKEGRLPAEKMGRDFFINESDLKLVANRKTGRPPGKVSTASKAVTRAATAKNGASVKKKGKK
jgi:excisionase family DNA binding protein